MMRLELKDDIFQQQLFLVVSKDDSFMFLRRESDPGEIYIAAEQKSRAKSFSSFKLPLSPQGKVNAEASGLIDKQKSNEVVDSNMIQLALAQVIKTEVSARARVSSGVILPTVNSFESVKRETALEQIKNACELSLEHI